MPSAKQIVSGKYRLVRRLGQGGMGEVWEAVHDALGRRVAIKFIDGARASSATSRRRFCREARAAVRVESKHAVDVFDQGLTDDGLPYIVMELLSGESLGDRLARRGRLTLHETSAIVSQVCRALSRAHASGVVHRDLKPENVFLARLADEPSDVVKLLDFGIAKIDTAFDRSQECAILGTPYFMSPEQARGATVDHRTDLWSVAVIAYLCVTGVRPFEGTSLADLLVGICHGSLLPPSQCVPGVPAVFDAFIARALDKNVTRRFQSAADLALALEECAAGDDFDNMPTVRQSSPPPVAVEVEEPSTFRRKLTHKRRRAMVGAASILVAAVAVLLSWSVVAGAGAPTPPAARASTAR
jgi:serine/threonine-protein kinase